jgi:polar amino acid transport system substrate-binding protein
MKKNTVLAILIVTIALLLAACGSSAPTGGQASTPTTAQTSTPTTAQTSAPKDLLSSIKSRGYVIVVQGPENMFAGTRPANTKCPLHMLTTAEMKGFDVDVAAEIGKRLGVEICFGIASSWSSITAGNWGDKWDVSITSMTITNMRTKVLTFTVPYYYDYAEVAVKKGSGISTLADLAGKGVCVESTSTSEDWLKGNLDLPAADVFVQPPANVKEVPVNPGQNCASATGFGTDFIAFVDASYVIDSDIAKGAPIVKLGGPVYRESLAAAVDNSSSLPTDSFVAELNKIITAMHSDGTLTKLSIQDNGVDYTQPLK